ncbi:MAG TPA: UDP-N-acetylmuramate dehydrogenase [Candidatus Saccharimonadales bacterium]|nr:UDP-N-acetylmuramate dehydrogenase [Candidatus Saccharimonadales bacterium]
MDIRQNEPLAAHSTMRLGGTAKFAVDVHSRQEMQEAVGWAAARGLRAIVVGQGSNIVWKDGEFDGLLIVNQIKGIEEQFEDAENYYITVGAGEVWDDVVALTASKGMTGIEALSLIPGTAGATPVQNVGAYGQEVSATLVSVQAYDAQAKQMVTLPGQDCAFGYRTSRFKTTDNGRFFITAVTFHLLHTNPQPPFYPGVQAYFDKHGVKEFTPQTVRDAVVAIRQARLPDPAQVANNGSFFANPFVDEGKVSQLVAEYGVVPHWAAGNGQAKMPAAWLVEQAGFKDSHDAETGMGTWAAQPIVLVNEHARDTAQVLAFKQKIVAAVEAKFGIHLEQEPDLLP